MNEPRKKNAATKKTGFQFTSTIYIFMQLSLLIREKIKKDWVSLRRWVGEPISCANKINTSRISIRHAMQMKFHL